MRPSTCIPAVGSKPTATRLQTLGTPTSHHLVTVRLQLPGDPFRTCPTLAEVIDQAHRGIERVRGTPYLAYSFLRRTGLSVG
jgi:hypothetical protein